MKFLNKLIYILTIFFLTFVAISAFANNSIQINIDNAKQIDEQAIYALLDEYKDPISDQELKDILIRLKKNIYISDINIEIINSKIVLNIFENEIINEIDFIGIKRFKKDDINSILPFQDFLIVNNEDKIKEFIKELKNLYLSYAYNNIDISYKIKKISNTDNLVDIKFNVIEGKISKVNKINFIGNDSFSKNILLSQIKSKEKNFLRFKFFNNFKKYVVKNDIIRIRNFYLSRGFRNINIESKTEFIQDKNKFNIYFYLDEGQLFTFDNINIDYHLKDLSMIQKTFIDKKFNSIKSKIINKNNKYNYDLVKKIKKDLADIVFNSGFNFFSIKINEEINEKKISLTYKIYDENPKFVNNINIFGNKRTKDTVIRRYFPFAEGEIYTSRDIDRTKSNLNKLGFFSNIKFDEKIASKEKYDVDLYIEEKSTGDFQIGISYATLEGATFISKLKEKNIAGTGRNLSLEFNNSDKNSRYNISLSEPYIFNKPIVLDYGIEYLESDLSSSKAYNLDTLKFQTGLKFDILDKLNYNFSIDYSLKNYTITDASKVSTSVKNSSGKNAIINISNGINFNNLNSYMNPTQGSKFTYFNTYSPSTNSNGSSIKNEFIHRKYIPYKKNIFSAQTRIGNITSLENKDLLNDQKFSLGGNWLRGFDSFGAGPRESYTSYVGGNNLFVTKLDFKRPLNTSNNPFYLNLFSDVGKVWGNKTNPAQSKNSIRSSYGYGFQWFSPIGPLGFSWAFPLQDEDYDIKRSFNFSIGGG